MTTAATEVKERPILFSGPMVKAIIEGKKTQTRRVIKPQPETAWTEWMITINLNGDNRYWVDGKPTMHLNMKKDYDDKGECPFGKPGDRLWVRETWKRASMATPDGIMYAADNLLRWFDGTDPAAASSAVKFPRDGKWKPSIFMPRWASRITLEVVNVRVERLQEISEEDAIAEGVYTNGQALQKLGLPPTQSFKVLVWINTASCGKASINQGVLVGIRILMYWCIEFRRV
jgi:hypothetical protein